MSPGTAGLKLKRGAGLWRASCGLARCTYSNSDTTRASPLEDLPRLHSPPAANYRRAIGLAALHDRELRSANTALGWPRFRV